jgi:hypothetical protein
MAQYGAAEASKSIWDFDPTSIGGCTLWLDGADPNTMLGSSGAIASNTLGDVLVWRDKSTSGNNAQSAVTNQLGAQTTLPTGSFIGNGTAVTLTIGSSAGMLGGTTRITITNVIPTSLQGTYTVTTVNSGTSITFPNTTASSNITTAGTILIGNLPINFSTSTSSTISHCVSMNNSSYAQGLTPGSTITFTGITPTAFNLSNSVISSVQAMFSVSVNSTGGTATYTVTPSTLGLLAQFTVVVFGFSNSAFNGTFSMGSQTTSTFTVSNTTDSGGTLTGGTIYSSSGSHLVTVNSTAGAGSTATAMAPGNYAVTNTRYPTIGSRGVAFNGNQYFSLNASLLPTGSSNATYFFVSRATSGSIRQSIFQYGGNQASIRQIGVGQTANSYYLQPGNVTASYPTSEVLTIPNNNLISFNIDNQIGSGWSNGTPFAIRQNQDQQPLILPGGLNTGSVNAAIGMGFFYLLQSSNPGAAIYPLTGTISEILVYNATLSNTDRQIVEGYLAWKWGLQSSLPTSHPYYLNKSAVSSFNPLNFGPTLWLDGKDASTISYRVSQWNDKSSLGNHVTQTTRNQQPVYRNNEMYFGIGSGIFTRFFIPDVTPYLNTDLTIFVVERRELPTGRFISGSGASGGNQLLIGYNNSTNMQQEMYDLGANTGVPAFTSATSEPFRIWSFTYTTSARRSYLNGGTGGTRIVAGMNRLSSWPGAVIGTSNATGNQLYKGSIKEIIFYNSELNTANRQAVEGYLAWKWGLENNLPTSGHLYKLSAPVGFSPKDSVTGCTLWLDASDSSTVTLGNTGFTWRDKSPSNLLAAIVNPTASTLPTYDSSNGGVVITTPTVASGLTPNFLTLPGYVAYGSIANGRPGQGTAFWASSSFSSNTNGRTIGNQSSFGHYSFGTTNGSSSEILTAVGNIGVSSPLWSSSQVINSNTITVKSLLTPGGFNTLFIIGGFIKSVFTTIDTSIDGLHPRATFTAGSSTMTLATDIRNLVITEGMTITAPYITTGSAIVNSVSGYNVTLSQNALSNQTNVQNYTASSSISTTIPSGTYITSATLVTPGSNLGETPTPGTYTLTLSQPVTIPAGNTPLITFGNNTITRNKGTTDLSATFNPTSSPFLYSLNVTGVGGTASFTINGGSVSSNSVSPLSVASSGDGTTLDFSAFAGCPSYTLYEFINYDISLTTAQRQQVEGYLAWKWGLQASLPSNHPFAPANYFYSNTRPFSRSFVPNDIPNCIMWFDGADLTTMFTNTAGTTAVTGTGSIVRHWRDKSNTGNNLTSDTADRSPTLTTSSTNPQKIDMVFDGGDYLSKTDVVNNSKTYTKFLVFYRNDTAAADYQRLFSYATSAGDQFNNDPSGFHIQANNSKTGYILFKSNASTGLFTISTNTYYIITIVATPLTMSLFLNGSLTATVSLTLPNTDFSGTTFRLGTNFGPGNNSYWAGFINEVISYNRQLDVAEYREVEGYLAWKWGVRSSLPATHPFNKFATPSLTPFQPELQLYKNTFDVADLDPIIWIDPQDTSSINLDATTNRILTIKSKINPTRSITDVPITLVSVTGGSFTVSLTSGLVIGSSITPLTLVAGSPGLAANTEYFIASISGSVVTLASSLANARSGTAISGFTTNASLNVTANVTLSISPNFTILSVASDIFTISSPNGLTIGTEITPIVAVAGTPGLVANTVYYVSLISGNTIRIATSLANAFSATHMTGFTDNASISNTSAYYSFCLSKPPSISGPLLTTSSVSNGPSLKYMECFNGGIFKLASASISGTTLTLTTEIPHNIPAGRQINLNILNGTYGPFGSSVTATSMGPFHVNYASVSGASGTILTLNTSTTHGIVSTNSVFLQVNTATYNAGSGGSAVDLTQGYTVPANISITATSSTTGTNVVTLSSVTGLAIGQGVQFTTSFGGIPANSTHYINTISGNNITISTSPFGVNRTLTTSETVSTGSAGTFGVAIVLTLPTAKTLGPIQLGDISIRNNDGLPGPYIVATSGTPNANTLTVTTYSTLTASTLSMLVGRIEYGGLALSSANLTSTTSMTIFTPIPHGLGNGDILSTSFIYLILPKFSSTFTTARVNATGTLLTITGLANTTIFTTTGQSTSLYIPPGTTFANGVQAASLSLVNIFTQTGTNGSTVVFTISTATANAGDLSFVTGQSGSISLGPFTGGGSAELNTTSYTVTAQSTNSFTFTIPAQSISGNVRGQNGCDSFVSNTGQNNSVFNFPVNGYALENTLLGGALVSRLVTMVYVSHLRSIPSRSTLSSPVQSPIIATSVSVNGGGGNDNVLFGRDYRIQVSFNAGNARFQLKHNAQGINQNPTYTGDLTSTASPFRVHSMIINTTDTNLGDIAAFTKCMAINGWRYSNVTSSDYYANSANITTSGALTTTVTGIKSTAGFGLDNLITKVTGTGDFGAGSSITSIDSATQITVTGTSNHTAGSITFRVTPRNSLLNQTSAATIGNIQTTSYLRPTHLRIGGDTAATTYYNTSPLCGSWYEGGIGDIIIFNSILSVEQRQLVEGFLAQKYHTAGTLGGVTTAANSSFIHPYRTNPTIISPSLDLTQLYTQGLATWFDAANSLTFGFASSNNINSWTSSGGNFTLTLVPNGTNYPTLVQDAQNKLPGVRFASSGTPLGTSFIYPITNFSTLSNNNEFTIITVYKQPTFTSSRVISNVIGSANNPRLLAYTDQFSYRNTTTEQTKNYTANVDGQAYISVYYRRERTLLVRDNGITDNGSTTSGTNLNIPSSLGSIFGVSLGAYSVSSPTASPFAGDIYEHIIFRYALTDQAIYQIEGYLAWKWGLEGSLPATHPYKRIRP